MEILVLQKEGTYILRPCFYAKVCLHWFDLHYEVLTL